MTMPRFLVGGLLMGVLLAIPVMAHQQQASTSRVVLNAQNHSLEVMHKLLLHDAEQVLKKISPRHHDILASEVARQRLVQHVVASFNVGFQAKSPGAKLSALELVGHEVEGKYLWVYQQVSLPEATSPSQLVDLQVRNEIFMAYFPQQINRVNIDIQGNTRTLVFDNQNRGEVKALQFKIRTENF